MADMFTKIDASTIFLTLAVIVAYSIAAIYIVYQKKNKKLELKKRWIEQLPSLISTCGVLGTFFGITKGLIGFDTNDIAGSIPTLLGGLSTAFFTSLAGMIGSLLLSRQVSSVYEKVENGISDATSAASMVVSAIQNQVSQQQNFYNSINNIIQNIDNRIQNIDSNILPSLLSQVSGIDSKTQNIDSNIVLLQKNQVDKSQIEKIIPDIQRVNNNIGEILDIEGAMSGQMDEVSEKLTKLTDKLHSEVMEIEDAMGKTNNLLEKKFNEFTELLKKSNTEALVEVMKKVTEEFQKQMGVLINKLVQENFEQLNKSVEQLNTWQVENKEMITSLTRQYKEMTDNFSDTSTVLTKVGDDTKTLVSDGGKLEQIVDALSKLLIEDEKFIEISTKLADTATLTKNNMEKFDDSTSSLNEWIKKQRNFVESVNLLILKLDEINKINDYSEEFWKNTRNGLNEAVGAIRSSVDSLNNEIEDLDEHFYKRLATTLSELDSCIQAMIKGRG